jgi:hypothetical protein
MKNPQALKQYEQLRKSNGDPRQMLQQMTGNYTPEQRKQFMQFANRFGFTSEQLNNFGINSK